MADAGVGGGMDLDGRGVRPLAMGHGMSVISALTEPSDEELAALPHASYARSTLAVAAPPSPSTPTAAGGGGGGDDRGPAPAPAQREASTRSGLWSFAASSMRSLWPTPYTTDARTGRRLSILRKVYEDRAQRSRRWRLLRSSLWLLLYLGVAVGVYGYGLEQWGAVKAMYFAVVTLTSIGFGDIVCSSSESRLFTVFFALAGIGIVAIGLGELVGYLLEENHKQMDAIKDMVSRAVVEGIRRRREKEAEEQRTLQHLVHADAAYAGVTLVARGGGGDSAHPSPSLPGVQEVVEAGGAGGGGHQQHEPPPPHVGLGSVATPSLVSIATLRSGAGPPAGVVGAAKEEGEDEGGKCGSELALVVIKALVPVVLINLVGAATIGAIEGWDFINVLYWATMSATTIGYGDIHPDKKAAYLVAIVYLPLAVVTVASAINTIATFLRHQREERRQRAEVLKLVNSWEMLGSMDRDQDGEVSLSDFMSYLLRLWGLVDDHTLRLIEARYQELDLKEEGVLRREDFRGRRAVGGGGGGSTMMSDGSCAYCGCSCSASSSQHQQQQQHAPRAAAPVR